VHVAYSSFNEAYVTGLRERNPEIESHFIAHFSKVIWLILRNRLRSPQLAEDARQETLLRVLQYFRSGKSLRHPERLPGFVHTTCKNVALEMIRSDSRHLAMPENAPDPVDERIDLDLDIVNEERKRVVREVLSKLSSRDRELLRLVFLEEMDKSEVCKRFHTDEDYLRVLLHRAKLRFRAALQKSAKPGGLAKLDAR
jgi:RNA polymerase sigma factor (sigma-70 family)